MSDRYQDELLQKQMANDNPFDTYVTKPETGKGLLRQSSFGALYKGITDGWLLL